MVVVTDGCVGVVVVAVVVVDELAVDGGAPRDALGPVPHAPSATRTATTTAVRRTPGTY
jgi:hypothetical protein